MKKALSKCIDFAFFNHLSIKIYSIYINQVDVRLRRLAGRVLVSKVKNKGLDLRIHGKGTIRGVENLDVGDYVRIGENGYLSCEGGLIIEDNVQISRNVTIYTITHDIETSAIPYNESYVCKPVVIKNSVWIGMNVVIAPGTIIGEGAVIGMGSVVSGEIPPGSVVVGQKHRIIKTRDMEAFRQKKERLAYFGKLYPDR